MTLLSTQPSFFGHGLEQFEGDDIDIASDFNGDVLEFRVKSNGDVGRNGPGRSGPDKTIDFAARKRWIDERCIGS